MRFNVIGEAQGFAAQTLTDSRSSTQLNLVSDVSGPNNPGAINLSLVTAGVTSSGRTGYGTGHSSGGTFDVIPGTGTNEIHGSLYEYFQKRNLNALDASYKRQGISQTHWNVFKQFVPAAPAASATTKIGRRGIRFRLAGNNQRSIDNAATLPAFFSSRPVNSCVLSIHHSQFTPGQINNTYLQARTDTRNYLIPSNAAFTNPETAFGNNARTIQLALRFQFQFPLAGWRRVSSVPVEL